MTLMQDVLQNSVSGISLTQVPENLNILATQDCAAAIWHRRPLPDFQAWIDRFELRPCYRTLGYFTPVRERGTKWDNIDAIIQTIIRQLQLSGYMSLRLEPITSNACRKLHIDAITARLVCTYRGTGTQYGISQDGAEPECIFTVPTGTPILLRGTLWPEQPRSGLLHRSPPIEGSGKTRLVLVLDPTFDLEEET
ncbi:MAG: hypothetical protein ACI8Z0_003219 [Lentimonas sp.]|jgi:hypothetical protein